MGKKRDLSDFERGIVVGARRAGLSILKKTADLLGFSHTTISKVYRDWFEKEKISSERQCGPKCLVDIRVQRRMSRLVRDDRKATLTRITTCYNQDMQNTISERTRRTLKQMGHSSRRPHRVPLLSAKNRKRSLQFTQAQQKIGKTLPGLMSLYFCCDIQMVGSEFGVKNMKPWFHPALSQWFRLVVVV